MLEGGTTGPAVVPGKPEESLLVQAVAHTHDELKMPPKTKLPEHSVSALRRWVEMGAPWPEAQPPSNAAAATAAPDRDHWAFRPVQAPCPSGRP